MPKAVKKSEYGGRHDRLRRRGGKLIEKAFEQPVEKKGEKKYEKLMNRAAKKFDKAKKIRDKKS
jgi:hypothetical protein